VPFIELERVLGLRELDFGWWRIQAITDDQLLRFGKAAAYMADPRNSADRRSVEPVFKIQLQECRAEWQRRHSKPSAERNSER
jgi:hypothetical protein